MFHPGSDAVSCVAFGAEPTASAHVLACPTAPQSMRVNRSAERRTSRWIRRDRPARLRAYCRSRRSLRFAMPCELVPVSTLRSPLLRLPSTPERLHQVDAGGEQILPAADERQLRQVDAALRIEHVEESGVARLIARVREAQSIAGGVDAFLGVALERSVLPYVDQRVRDLAERGLDRLLIDGERLPLARALNVDQRSQLARLEDRCRHPGGEGPDAARHGKQARERLACAAKIAGERDRRK